MKEVDERITPGPSMTLTRASQSGKEVCMRSTYLILVYTPAITLNIQACISACGSAERRVAYVQKVCVLQKSSVTRHLVTQPTSIADYHASLP